MKLPNAERAVVPKTKITRYLLDLNHKKGGPKAKFFLGHGYSLANWEMLKRDLLWHAMEYEVDHTVLTSHGLKYIIDGRLKLPSGQMHLLRTVWIIRTDEDFPRLVIAHPEEE